MPGLYSHTSRAAGLTLTANIYNTDHTNHITNHITTQMDDYSSSVAQMQTNTDPGEVGSESQSTSLAGEIERLRFAIKEMKGSDGTQWYTSVTGTLSRSILPRAYIGGYGTSNATGDSDHDIQVAAGDARSDTNDTDILTTGNIIKRIDGTWASGSGSGGLITGSVSADGTYAVWVIKATGDGDVDVMFATSFASGTAKLPSGYDKKRLIGAVATDTNANIIGYKQVGDYFRYTGDVITDISNDPADDTFVTGTLSVPPNSLAHIYGKVTNTVISQARLQIKTFGAADAVGADNESFVLSNAAGSTGNTTAGIGSVLVDPSSKVEYAADEGGGNTSVVISTLGFTMLTRSAL